MQQNCHGCCWNIHSLRNVLVQVALNWSMRSRVIARSLWHTKNVPRFLFRSDRKFFHDLVRRRRCNLASTGPIWKQQKLFCSELRSKSNCNLWKFTQKFTILSPESLLPIVPIIHLVEKFSWLAKPSMRVLLNGFWWENQRSAPHW